MRKPGFILSPAPGQRKAMIDVAQELDRRGFPHVLCPHEYAGAATAVAPYDSLSMCTAVIQATKRMKVASGVAVTYSRPPHDMAAAAAFNHEISDGRFSLGLGVGYDGILRRFGIESEPPLPHMRRYVAAMQTSAPDEVLPPVILAALRPGMMRLAGEIADGMVGGCWALSYVREALAAIPEAKRERFIVANIVQVYPCEDRSEGLAFMRRLLGAFMKMPSYPQYFIAAGFADEVERAGAALEIDDREALWASISDRMAEEMGIFGNASTMRGKVEEWQAAGVNWLTLSTIFADKDRAGTILRVADVFD